ncbi:hypothetical protein IKQ21_09510, partial [bacterium]|nr:hypothetical protein [bacterium]
MKRTALILSIFLLLSNTVWAYDNTLRTDFLNNKTRIYGINIRNFNAQDTNKHEIIDPYEESGNFINAAERLDEIRKLGINTLHVLPITPVGKLKSLGTAGSLYAAAGFDSINEQLLDTTSELSPEEQVKFFVNECHKRGIRVIIDLPSCGSYDLYLKNPELFIRDDKNISIVPSDWTDVRLLNTGTNGNLNQDVLNIHKKFVDMVLNIGFDGIRADVATIKPYEFWVELIKYTREKDPEFLFLAEASDSWREPPSKYAEFTPYDELLAAGFDGYYGSFFNLKEWNAEEFIEHIKFNKKLLSSYPEKKSVILSFTTHDEVSPVILHGTKFSEMICWLEATLPYNPYSIDGFAQGDNYLYRWANNKAKYTDTDDDYYFVHRGKIDIFNFSRKPICKNTDVLIAFKKAYRFRIKNEELITNGNFIPLKTNDEKVFAFERSLNKNRVIVFGNLDFKNEKDSIRIKVPKLKKNADFDMINGQCAEISRNEIKTELDAGEIKVMRIK